MPTLVGLPQDITILVGKDIVLPVGNIGPLVVVDVNIHAVVVDVCILEIISVLVAGTVVKVVACPVVSGSGTSPVSGTAIGVIARGPKPTVVP